MRKINIILRNIFIVLAVLSVIITIVGIKCRIFPYISETYVVCGFVIAVLALIALIFEKRS